MILTKHFTHPLQACLLAIAVCTTLGCSGGSSVTGQVTVDGEPLEKGIITFRPQEPSPEVRGVQAEVAAGKFEITAAQGLPEGSYKVMITARRKTGRQIPVEEGSPEMEDETEQYLPPAYNIQTELTAEITESTEGLLFETELPKKRGKRR